MAVKNGSYNLVQAPDDYPGKTYHHGYVPEHHLVWWEETGEVVRDDEIIHHKNEDTRDNSFENLQKMTRSEHSALHNEARGVTMAVLECLECGDVFERRKNKTYLSKPGQDRTCCSRSCGQKYKHRDEQKNDNVIFTYVA